MSKIEEYQQAKKRAASFRAFAIDVRNIRHCDKFGAEVTIGKTWRGYYGDSSAGAWPTDMIGAIQQILVSPVHLRQVAEYAAEQAERAAELARKAAEAEARDVLTVIDSERQQVVMTPKTNAIDPVGGESTT